MQETQAAQVPVIRRPSVASRRVHSRRAAAPLRRGVPEQTRILGIQENGGWTALSIEFLITAHKPDFLQAAAAVEELLQACSAAELREALAPADVQTNYEADFARALRGCNAGSAFAYAPVPRPKA